MHGLVSPHEEKKKRSPGGGMVWYKPPTLVSFSVSHGEYVVSDRAREREQRRQARVVS